MNRLSGALSPYLLSHAHQSVDWFPWGPDAFAEAARRECPVMISIGYSTCHWCHVMSRESFDDEATADILNQKVVSIKVDREEHPEVDALYMAQAQAFTDHLGWPLTIFATPEGAAFYAQTYLPPEPRSGQPSLLQVVEAVSTAWREKRDEVLQSSRALVEALADATGALENESSNQAFPSVEQLSVIVEALVAQEDTEFGGFGGAPKFPTSPALSFLQGEGFAGHELAAECVSRTLSTYAGSDLRDSLEGGFFRYSTMRDFSEPHYERMLYDNAGLLSLYSREGDLDPASGIVEFLRSTLIVEGGFGSAQDSESFIEGEASEGGYYALDASSRSQLTPPAVDDKVITGWNGMALSALAHAHLAGVPGDPGELGSSVATMLLEKHVHEDGTLIRLSKGGIPSSAPATLEDYGGLSLGLLELGMALGEARFVGEAFRLLDSLQGKEHSLGVDDVMRDNGLSVRPDIQEGAAPSGIAMTAQALLLAATLRGARTDEERARALVAPHVSQALLTPLGAGGILQAFSSLARDHREIIVISDGPTELAEVARRSRVPGTLVLCLSPEQARSFLEVGVGLLEGRTEAASPLAYVCDRGVCQLPVKSSSELEAQL
ncbi:MAG: DUF255 domain-containing protein [Pontimonas sp.]